MRSIAAGLASAFEVEIGICPLFPALENHETETAAFADATCHIDGAKNVLTEPRPVMGTREFRRHVRRFRNYLRKHSNN